VLGNSAEKGTGLILWIVRELFNRRRVLNLKIFNNENVKLDNAEKVILQDRKDQRLQLMTFQNRIYVSENISLRSMNSGDIW
jgi:hypothetical protein